MKISCIPDKEILGFSLGIEILLTHVISAKKENFHMNLVCIGCIGCHATLSLGRCHNDDKFKYVLRQCHCVW